MSRRMTRHSPGKVVSRVFSGAALTALPVTDAYTVTEPARGLFSCSVYVGRCSVAGSTSFQISQSNGDGIWANLGSTLAVTSSTDTAADQLTGEGIITATGHPFTTGQYVTVAASVTLPPEYDPSIKYVLEVIDANTVSLRLPTSEAVIVASVDSDGMTITPIRELLLDLNAADSTDSADMPPRGLVRALLTKANSDSVQLMDFRVTA